MPKKERLTKEQKEVNFNLGNTEEQRTFEYFIGKPVYNFNQEKIKVLSGLGNPKQQRTSKFSQKKSTATTSTVKSEKKQRGKTNTIG